MHITYQNGGYSNNLWAQNSTAELVEECVLFTLNLDSNFRIKNKQSNQFLDATELVESASKLKFIQIDDAQTLSGLERFWKEANKPPIKLALSLGDHGVANYSVDVESKEHYVQFDVTSLLD